MKRALISDLHAAVQQRSPGYLEACLKVGKISRDGQWMIFDDAAHNKLRQQFTPSHLVPPTRKIFPAGRAAAGMGLGDVIHKIAGPIGRAIHWPCMKGDGSTDLKPGSPCAKARDLANKVKI
jgi:hypothetical protein